MSIFTTAILLTGGSALFAQAPTTAAKDQDHSANAKTKAKAAASDADVTYGTVKELTAGQKVVIAVDNAIDKTFDLTDKDVSVKLPANLKVGDTVKVNEHSVMGKTKTAVITKAAAKSAGKTADKTADKPPAAK